MTTLLPELKTLETATPSVSLDFDRRMVSFSYTASLTEGTYIQISAQKQIPLKAAQKNGQIDYKETFKEYIRKVKQAYEEILNEQGA